MTDDQAKTARVEKAAKARETAQRLIGDIRHEGREWMFDAATDCNVVRTFSASTKREISAKRNSLVRAMVDVITRDYMQHQVDSRHRGFALKVGFVNYSRDVV